LNTAGMKLEGKVFKPPHKPRRGRKKKYIEAATRHARPCAGHPRLSS
jgi:hypothetical protein